MSHSHIHILTVIVTISVTVIGTIIFTGLLTVIRSHHCGHCHSRDGHPEQRHRERHWTLTGSARSGRCHDRLASQTSPAALPENSPAHHVIRGCHKGDLRQQRPRAARRTKRRLFSSQGLLARFGGGPAEKKGRDEGKRKARGCVLCADRGRAFRAGHRNLREERRETGRERGRQEVPLRVISHAI